MVKFSASLLRVTSRLRLPLLLVGILAAIYLTELILAGSLAYDAAYGYVTSLPHAYDPIIAIGSPFLHSSHDHILWNSIHLVILGGIVLIDESEREFLTFFLLTAWLTAAFVPALVGGDRGLGISGAIAALSGWAAVNRIRVWYSFSNGTDDSLNSYFSWRLAKIIFLMAIPLAIFIHNIGQGIGFYEEEEGVSVLGHFSGALIGILYGIQELIRDLYRR